MKVLLVDPSLFTAPYDAALTEGLLAAGVRPSWATRPTRKGDRQEIPSSLTDTFFYRRVDQADWLPGALKPLAKGAAHFLGLLRLLIKARTQRPAVVHFQWVVVPLLDVLAMAVLRRWCALVLTVHDTVPYNGEKMSWLQRVGYDAPMKMAHRVIVHTRAGRQALIDRGVALEKIAVIAHGALRLAAEPSPHRAPRDPRWTFLLFGEIKPYKGLDVLVEALALLPAGVRDQCRLVVAGRPRMEMAPVVERAAELGLTAHIEWRLARQSEQEMASLFADADCFVFPYRQIDASGVYFLAKPFGKWLVASRVGVFAEDVVAEVDGSIVPPDDPAALSAALASVVERRPQRRPTDTQGSWRDIGLATLQVYRQALPTTLLRPSVVAEP